MHSNWCRLVGGFVVAVAVTGNCLGLGLRSGLEFGRLVVW